MRAFTSSFLRLFVILLLSVFIAETVYASSMMVGLPLAQSVSKNAVLHQYEDVNDHCHSMKDNQQSDGQSHEKQSNGSHCHHCVACFSMISQGQFNFFAISLSVVEKIAFVEIYHSPTSIQLQKPPIL